MKRKTIYFTVDMEPDCPPYLDGWRGVIEGAPRLLALFARHEIRATLFCTGELARRFPDEVARWRDAGHELACHGDSHERLSSLGPRAAYEDIARATETLSTFAEMRSFRAPNLDLPAALVPRLATLGYQLDSSEGRHKHWRAHRRWQDGIWRVPASTTSSVLRLPSLLTAPLVKYLDDPVVLFVHPWELVDLRRENLRWDCRVGTGPTAHAALDGLFRRLRDANTHFAPLRELVTH